MAIKTKTSKGFSKELHRLARQKRFPLRAMFELTYQCNFKCIHCYNSEAQKKTSRAKELKTKEVLEILRQLRSLNCFYLGLTGGEIFTRPDILKIISAARKLGFKIILLTNASLIDEKTVKQLKKIGLNKIDITVHALDKKIFEQITRVPRSYEKVFQTIRLLHQRKIPLGLKSCGMNLNRDEIIKVSRFARGLDAIYRFDGELIPRSDGEKTPLTHSLSPREIYTLRRQCYPEMFEKYDQKKQLRQKTKPRRDLKRLFNCGAGYTDLTINPYGELKICLQIDYPRYKILEGSLEEGWKKIKNFIDELKPPKNWACKRCDLSPYCSWCPGRSYLEKGDFTSCSQFHREQAGFLARRDA